MENAQQWKQLLNNWPRDMPRRGVLITSYDEQIVFSDFLLGEDMVLVERNSPDAMGARKVILPYQNILALKIIDVVRSKTIRKFGFVGAGDSDDR